MATLGALESEYQDYRTGAYATRPPRPSLPQPPPPTPPVASRGTTVATTAAATASASGRMSGGLHGRERPRKPGRSEASSARSIPSRALPPPPEWAAFPPGAPYPGLPVMGPAPHGIPPFPFYPTPAGLVSVYDPHAQAGRESMPSQHSGQVHLSERPRSMAGLSHTARKTRRADAEVEGGGCVRKGCRVAVEGTPCVRVA